MKKVYNALLLAMLFMATTINAQSFIPHTNPAFAPVGGFTSNTGVAVAPASFGPSVNLSAIVADYGTGSNSFQIDWVAQNGANLQSMTSLLGEDPDVCYYVKADLLYAVSANMAANEILLHRYYLTSLPPTLNYNYSGFATIGNGITPNIDMNSQGLGAVVWNDGGAITLNAFDGGQIYSPVVVGNGSNPDVAVHDNQGTTRVTVTYIDASGDLVIKMYGYSTSAAFMPTAIMPGPQVWTDTPGGTYKNPRISTMHHTNAVPGTNTNFTVVVGEAGTPFNPTQRVWGFFFDASSTLGLNKVIVNPTITGCRNQFPVVTYQFTRVIVAWSYDGGCGGFGQDVLMREFSHDGVSAGDYLQVPSFSAPWGESKTSISTKYDSGYGVTWADFYESIVFSDPGDYFTKNRSAGSPFYKEAKVDVEPFAILTNPVQEEIRVAIHTEEATQFTLFSIEGKVLRTVEMPAYSTELSIPVDGIVDGMLYLQCTDGTQTKTFPVVKQ